MSKIRLVASDMDGTLLNQQKQISDENRAAINQLQQHNIIFSIASGRNIAELQKYRELFDFPIPFIALNGGIIYNEQAEIIEHHPFPIAELTELVELLSSLNVYFELLDECHFFSNSPAYRLALIEQVLCHAEIATNAREDDRFTMTKFSDYTASLLTQHPFYKLRIFNLDDSDLAKVEQIVCSMIPCEISSSAKSNIEINPSGVTKGQAILSLCNYYHLSAQQVFAIGDNINDLSMLSIAGQFCAMANSHPHILNKSDLVTDTNDNDGVAKALYQFVLP